MYLFLAFGLFLVYLVTKFEDWFRATHPQAYWISGTILLILWFGLIAYCMLSEEKKK